MTSKERLLTALRGGSVDRPAVSFYEIDGYLQDTVDSDAFNIYNAQSWQPLLRLARERSDSTVAFTNSVRALTCNPLDELTRVESWHDEHGARFTRRSLRAKRRTLTSVVRRDREVNTEWTLEHFIKDTDDFEAWLALPEEELHFEVDATPTLDLEAKVGDGGIVVQDVADAVCCVASLFDMGTWTVMALTEQALIQRALERVHRGIVARLTAACAVLPGRLWRIVGPEYASEPYLPPSLFRKYVTEFDKELVATIHRSGGWARVHSHGCLRNILDAIADTGCDALDPIEPPHQGDISLAEVRARYGDRWTLFGNLEATDLENLPTPEFEKKIASALKEGVGGKGFVLMPSASPYGRNISAVCLRNYKRMIEMAEGA